MPRKRTSAKLIHSARLRAKLGVPQLAEVAGIDASHLHQIEAGKYEQPTIPTLQKLGRALNCDWRDLAGD